MVNSRRLNMLTINNCVDSVKNIVMENRRITVRTGVDHNSRFFKCFWHETCSYKVFSESFNQKKVAWAPYKDCFLTLTTIQICSNRKYLLMKHESMIMTTKTMSNHSNRNDQKSHEGKKYVVNVNFSLFL